MKKYLLNVHKAKNKFHRTNNFKRESIVEVDIQE